MQRLSDPLPDPLVVDKPSSVFHVQQINLKPRVECLLLWGEYTMSLGNGHRLGRHSVTQSVHCLFARMLVYTFVYEGSSRGRGRRKESNETNALPHKQRRQTLIVTA